VATYVRRRPSRARTKTPSNPTTILDGEIVALDAEGVPRFQLLQQWQKRQSAPVGFCHTQKREQPFGNGIGEAYGSGPES
jgi:hypothetical protein